MDLFGLTAADLQRLKDALQELDSLHESPAPEPRLPMPGETSIFGKLQTSMSAVASSGGTPTSAVLDQYKFTSTGGTTATGDTQTIYNLTLNSATTVGWVTAKRESRSGLFMMQSFTGGSGTAFLTALVNVTTGFTGAHDPAIDTITDSEGSTQAAIGSSRITNIFQLAGKNNDQILLLPWGTQATTTGGTETVYYPLQAKHHSITTIDDVRVTTGTTNVLQGRQVTGWTMTTSTTGTWSELVEVGECT